MSSVEKLEVTVVSAGGLKRSWFLFPKCFIELEVGDEVRKTKVADRGRLAVWNEVLLIEVPREKDFTIKLYRKGFVGWNSLLGRFTGRFLESELDGQDRTIEITSSSTITLRMKMPLSNPPSRIFALVIGIDEYKSSRVENLEGCVNDAKAIKSLLVEHMKVPDSQIALLTNESATRKAIVSQFLTHLVENPSIERGDPILVYYAGRGSRAVPPSTWMFMSNTVETICPHDEWLEDPEGGFIAGIPDRTINALLRKLARVKGDNITVILDCCHAADTEGRPTQNKLLRDRSSPTPCLSPDTFDKDLRSLSEDPDAIGADLPSVLQDDTLSTHVLLAACRYDQRACETRSIAGHPSGGLFTNSLIRRLRQVALDSTTYGDLVGILPTYPGQKPQCKGVNKDRILFSSAKENKRMFELRARPEGKFEIDAGTTQGLAIGTNFSIEADSVGPLIAQDLHVFEAVEVDTNQSVLDWHRGHPELTSMPEGAKAVISRSSYGETSALKVFVDSVKYPQVASSAFSTEGPVRPPRNQDTHWPKPSFRAVDSISDADVVIQQESSGEFIIERLDTLISTYADRVIRIPGERVLDRLPGILDAMAHFKFYLERHNSSDIAGGVTMEIYRITQTVDGFDTADMTIGNLLVDNEVTFALDKDAEYGGAIFNHSNLDLYPYLFYFDPSDYTMQLWYEPPSRTIPPLRRALDPNTPTKITVGYGVHGGPTVQYALPDGAQADTSFLKLFVSTKWVDMGWIVRDSPFDDSVNLSVRSHLEVDGGKETQGAGLWDSHVAAITVTDPHNRPVDV